MLQLFFVCFFSLQLIKAAESDERKKDPVIRYMQIMKDFFAPSTSTWNPEDIRVFKQLIVDAYAAGIHEDSESEEDDDNSEENLQEGVLYYDPKKDNKHLKIARKLFPDHDADQAQYPAPRIDDNQSDDNNHEDPEKNYQEWLKMQEEAQAKAAQQVLDLEWLEMMQEDQSDDEEDQEIEEAEDALIIRKKLSPITLEELLAGIPPDFTYPDDVQDFTHSTAIGQEIL